MSFRGFFKKVGRLRFYSGDVTPRWFEVPFRGSFEGPVDRRRPEDRLQLDRGKASHLAHYTQGPDDPIYEPLPLTISTRLANTEPNYSKLLTVIRGRIAAGVTVASVTKIIGGQTWTTAKGSTQIADADWSGMSLITTPPFTDPSKWCVNVELLYTDPDGSNHRGFKWGDVYFPPDQRLTEGEDTVDVTMNGEVYGNVSLITAFTAGLET